MTREQPTERRRAVQRDSALAVLAGPLKFIAPTLAYVFLYPLMLARTGMEVVGVWSLLGAIVAFIGLADIGFSQLLARELGPDMDGDRTGEAYKDYTASVRAYIALLVLMAALFMAFQGRVVPLFGGVYPARALSISILLVLTGAIIQLIGKLDSAVLSAYNDNYTVQIVTAIAPVFTYVPAVIGAFVSRPIEGLAIGVALSGLATVAALRMRLSSSHGRWTAARRSQSMDETARRLAGLSKRGWYLYGSSVGLLIRGPVFRFVIAATLGLQATAMFDIAMRLTQTVRDAVASGFNVLYPSFSYLHRNKDMEGIIELMRVSLMVLLPLGAASLGVLVGVADHVLALWLREYPPELAGATRVLALWQVITIANVPFWFLLQATHHEKAAAYSVWAHTASVILVFPFQRMFGLGLMNFLIYWTLTSVLTQGLIYFHIQSKLHLLWDVALSPRVLALLVMVSAFFLWCFLLPFEKGGRQAAAYCAFGALVFSGASAVTVGKPVYRFVRSRT